jgi:hypothetical protein
VTFNAALHFRRWCNRMSDGEANGNQTSRPRAANLSCLRYCVFDLLELDGTDS